MPLQLHLIEILAAGHYLSGEAVGRSHGHAHSPHLSALREVSPDSDSRSRSRGMPIVCRPDAPFLVHVSAHLHFRPDEIQTLATVLESLSDTSTPVRLLREKIRRLRNDHVLVLDDSDQRIGQNIRQISKPSAKSAPWCSSPISRPAETPSPTRIVDALFSSCRATAMCVVSKFTAERTKLSASLAPIRSNYLI